MSDLPKGWSKICFDDICEIARGGSPRPIQEYLTDDPEGINWIKISDATQSDRYIYKTKQKIKRSGISRSRIVKDGDFILSNSMSFGRPYIVKTEGCIHDGWLVLSINSEVFDQDYLYYFLSSQEAYKQFDSKAAGSTVRNLNIDIVKTVEALIPPLAEQKRIVTKLDSLFAHTRRARQELDHIPKLIERYKQAILSAAFRGDLTADWRKENNQIINAKKFLIDSGIMPCKDVELSPLPDTWIWALTGDLCNIKSGVALGKKRSLGTELIELPYLRVANVQKGWLDLSEIKTVLVTQKEAESLYLQSGDILMNEGGDRDKLGRGHVWNSQVENCIHQNHVFRLRLKSQKISPFYISYYANELGQQYFIGQGKQTTNLASISMSKLSRFPIPVAPPEEMQVILQLIEKELKKIEILRQEVSKAYKFLDRLEQSTLAKAFRGEIVPQDPNDEPASILLERIQKERENQQTPKKRQLSLFKEKT